MPMNEQEKKKIIQELESRGVKNSCPRCSNSNFVLLDGYFNHPIQPELSNGMVIGGPSVPAVVTACSRCGFLSTHAMGVLGLLDKNGNNKDEK